jgi:peptidoglycan L-alanyl-D-glutamate endopeptidase CwlK
MSVGNNSRNIDDLHPVVARGCRELIRRMGEIRPNDPVGINQTWRDIDYQNWLFAQGRTRPGNVVTNAIGGQSPHNYRVAFDIHKNIRGQEFSDISFFNDAGRIWVEMGGVWGGNFRSFVDRPHFEFTGGLTIAQMRLGQSMPQNTKMPWEIKKEKELMKMVYRTVQEMPEWARPGIQELIDANVLSGRAPDNLDVDENMMRTLLIVRNMFEKAGLMGEIAK